MQRRARLQRRAKAEWAELSWARPNGERLGSRRCRRHPSLPLFCGTRSARREVRLTGFGAPRVGPSAVDPRPVRACEWLAVRELLAPVRWRASETSSPWEGAIEPSAEGWPVGDRPSAGAVRVACGASGDGRPVGVSERGLKILFQLFHVPTSQNSGGLLGDFFHTKLCSDFFQISLQNLREVGTGWNSWNTPYVLRRKPVPTLFQPVPTLCRPLPPYTPPSIPQCAHLLDAHQGLAHRR